MYAVSNQEDLLLCGAGMRLCRRMLAGPQLGCMRQIVPGLSSEDCGFVSADSVRHFPILVRVDSELALGPLGDSIEFSMVRELIFRSEDERSRVAHVRMKDVVLEGIPTAVRPKLFAQDCSVLAREESDATALAPIQASNRAAGALCGALAVVVSRRDVGPAMVPFFGTVQESPLNVFFGRCRSAKAFASESALLAICCNALNDARESNESDPSLLADLLMRESSVLAPP